MDKKVLKNYHYLEVLWFFYGRTCSLKLELIVFSFIWDQVFKSGPSKICGRQALKNLTWSTLEYLDSYVELDIFLLFYSKLWQKQLVGIIKHYN